MGSNELAMRRAAVERQREYAKGRATFFRDGGNELMARYHDAVVEAANNRLAELPLPS